MSMTVASGAIEPTQLFAVFQASIQPDEAVRKQAESHLKEVSRGMGKSGFLHFFFLAYIYSWIHPFSPASCPDAE